MSPTVASSRTVRAAAVTVAVCGTPVEAVVRTMNWSCAKFAILASLTAPATMPAVGRPVQFVSVPLVGVPRTGVTNVGLVALASPPVPVLVAPPRVLTIAATVVSSSTVLAALVIVAVSGTPVDAVTRPMN